MPHVPNISFREALGIGRVGTLGQSDFASPDSPFRPLRSPGTLDRCTAIDAGAEPPPLFMFPNDTGLVLRDALAAGQAGLAEQTYRLPPPSPSPPKLTQKDFEDAAQALRCEVAAVKAVAEVEARGSGFFADGRPKILFEAHVFSRLTSRVWDKLHPLISSSTWKKELYLGGVREYQRLEQAIKLDARAAIQSASWGVFQIMGFNYREAGAAAPDAFVASMYTGERLHLMAFANFLLAMDLEGLIQTKNWTAFAKAYNGPRYKDNDYDARLAKAYAKHAAPAAKPPPPPAPPRR